MRDRWRLVTVQNGKRHVSSVVLNETEADDMVQAELGMHHVTGWDVEVDERRPGEFSARTPDRKVLRTVRAECFDAMHDVLS